MTWPRWGRASIGSTAGCCSTTRSARTDARSDRPRRLLQPGLHLAFERRTDLAEDSLVVRVAPLALDGHEQAFVDQPQVDRAEGQRFEFEELASPTLLSTTSTM